jgi:hypothetical protein
MDHRPSDHIIASVLRPPVEVHRMPPADDPRFEVKFTIEPNQIDAALAWIKTHRTGWQTAYPDRVVNNVYFDTPDLLAYDDNQAGISERRKMRFRWYGEAWKWLTGTLEAKCRSGTVGWKWNAVVDHPFDLTTMTWQQMRDQLRANLPPVHRFLLDAQPLATLINRYHRAYYESRCGQLRLTIDQDIAFYPQLGRMRPQIRHASNKLHALVIEVKCAARLKNVAADVLTDIPFRAGRHSKYALGIESIENL